MQIAGTLKAVVTQKIRNTEAEKYKMNRSAEVQKIQNTGIQDTGEDKNMAIQIQDTGEYKNMAIQIQG